MQDSSMEMIEFAFLFERVARWTAIEFGVGTMMSLSAENFNHFLNAYYNGMAKNLYSMGAREKILAKISAERGVKILGKLPGQ